MLKVGILGCGWAGKVHAKVFSRHPATKVVALSDPVFEAAKALSTKHGIDEVYTDYLELLENNTIDILSICTPTSTHEKIALEAVEHISGLLIEKPMARSAQECEAIISACDQNHVKLSVCHNRLFYPTIKEAYQKLKEDQFPNRMVKIVFELSGAPKDHWKAQEEEGGMLWEEGSHAAYLLHHFLGDFIKVEAFGTKTHYSVHDDIRAFLKTKQGQLGLLELSWTAGRDLTMEVFTLEHAPMSIDLGYRDLISISSRSTSQFVKETFKRLPSQLLKLAMAKAGVRKEKARTSYHDQLINQFIQSMLDDNDPPVTGEQGKEAVYLLDCIEKSILDGSSVSY